MPQRYYYYGGNDREYLDPWVQAAHDTGQGFSRGMAFGIEQAMLGKRKKQDFEDDARKSGYIPEDEAKVEDVHDPNTVRIKVGDKMWVKPLSPMERANAYLKYSEPGTYDAIAAMGSDKAWADYKSILDARRQKALEMIGFGNAPQGQIPPGIPQGQVPSGTPQEPPSAEPPPRPKLELSGWNPKSGPTFKPPSSEENVPLSEDALNTAGYLWITTGQMPALGFANKGAYRQKIMNRGAEMAKQMGMTPEGTLLRQSEVKASQGSLKNLTKNKDMILSFENTANRNLKIAADLSQKVDRTGVPVFNRWLLAGKRSLMGDPEVAKFDAAIRTSINEYARVVTTVTGGGVTSDSARKEVESLLNTAQTPEQVLGVIQTLQLEMENRRMGYESQEGEIKGRIGGGGKEPQGKPKDDPLGLR